MISDGKLSVEQLLEFMTEEAYDFFYVQVIKNNMTIKEYAKKLSEKATIAYQLYDGNIVGLVAGYTNNLSDNCSYITQVFVSSDLRGRGIATKLLNEYFEYCVSKNINSCWLTTKKNNIASIKTYQKSGFVIDTDYESDTLYKLVKNLNVRKY
ncbi:MAG: GNAT family N-acetyltransferase [Oscillospiraceae bacterium]|nr:GNAT family N-acetyltransferase [Oscillospiraceae bacterium]